VAHDPAADPPAGTDRTPSESDGSRPVTEIHSPLSTLGPRRIDPAWIVIGAVRWLRALGLPLAIALLTGGALYSAVFYVSAVAFGVLVTLMRFFEWLRLRYQLDSSGLRVTSGLISRQERFVPLDRIQAVDIDEGLLQRMFGVVGVRIETAAGGLAQTDVRLEALKRNDALELRERLRPVASSGLQAPDRADGAADSAHTAAVGDQPVLLRAITPWEVVVAGATSARIGPALAIVIAGLELFRDVIGAPLASLLGIERNVSVTGLISLLAVCAAAGWLLAVLSAVLSYSGFQIRRDGERLLIQHGLFERRRRSIPIARIQAVRISEGLLRQPLGLASVEFDSAGYGRTSADSGILFPLIPRAHVTALLAEACPAFSMEQDRSMLNRPPARARRRYALQPTWGVLLFSVIATCLAAWIPWTAWWWGALPLALVPCGVLLGLWRYRDAGWALDSEDRLIVRGRSIERTTAITLRRRIQYRSVLQTPLQRRARLATFQIAVASGGHGRRIGIAHLESSTALAIATEVGQSQTTAGAGVPH
jgi:putative membrane protein